MMKSALRQTTYTSRRLASTARPVQFSRTSRNLVGAGLVASAIYLTFPVTLVNNDVDEEKVALEHEKAETQVAASTHEAEVTDEVPIDIEVEVVEAEVVEGDDAEADGHQSAAFNPETGEINWDCPCLGGMADGPCGEEFKEAFSCFVYSETEPKGVDCIKKFEAMRTCFKQHPEHYKEELYEDDDVPSVDDAEVAPVVESEGETKLDDIDRQIIDADEDL